jgi:hypothetical protein
MNATFRNQIVISLLILLILGCQPNKDSEAVETTIEPVQSKSMSDEEEEINKTLNRIFMAVGNRDTQTLRELTYEKAKIAWTYAKNDKWESKEMNIEGYLQNIEEKVNPQPFSETVGKYDISITEGRLANVIAPTTISQYGVARSNEVNHISMMKDNDQWKLLSVAWTVERIPEEERTFDLNLFAESYAQVWCGNRPDFVAMFYEEDGSLNVNDGDPSIGRDAISNVAQSFMTQFPDMMVYFDSLSQREDGIAFHWTLTGTDANPNGKGHKVKINGYELWTLSENNLIQESKGHFDVDEYNRQLEFGLKD